MAPTCGATRRAATSVPSRLRRAAGTAASVHSARSRAARCCNSAGQAVALPPCPPCVPGGPRKTNNWKDMGEMGRFHQRSVNSSRIGDQHCPQRLVLDTLHPEFLAGSSAKSSQLISTASPTKREVKSYISYIKIVILYNTVPRFWGLPYGHMVYTLTCHHFSPEKQHDVGPEPGHQERQCQRPLATRGVGIQKAIPGLGSNWLLGGWSQYHLVH